MRKKIVLLMSLILITAATLRIVPNAQAATPTVAVASVYNITEPGMTFQVNITITDVTDLSMWIINMSWDPNMLQIPTGDRQGLRKRQIYYNIYEGPFMESFHSAIFTANEIDNVHGRIRQLACGYAGAGTPAWGSGVLATINFTSVNVGTITIEINGPSIEYPGHSMLLDNSGYEMPHEDIDGTVTEHAPPLIWMEPWFQATTVGIIVVIVAATYVIKKKSVRHPTKSEKGSEMGARPVNVK